MSAARLEHHASGGRGVLEEPADIDYESSGWGGASPEDFDFDFLLCDAATDDDELEGEDENDETDPDEDPALTDGEGSDEDGYKGDKMEARRTPPGSITPRALSLSADHQPRGGKHAEQQPTSSQEAGSGRLLTRSKPTAPTSTLGADAPWPKAGGRHHASSSLALSNSWVSTEKRLGCTLTER